MNTNLIALGARCPLHSETQAVGACDHCGRFLCPACVSVRDEQRIVCEECVPDWAPRDGLHYVPVGRLAVMSLLTAGIYPVAWHYKLWKSMAARHREPNIPLLRALFSPLTYPLMLRQLRDNEPDAVGLSGWLGLGHLVFAFLSVRDELWALILGAFGWVFLLPVAAMIAKNTPDAVLRKRDPLGPRHLVAGTLGALLWALIVLGEMAERLDL